MHEPAETTHDALVAFIKDGIGESELYTHPACRTSSESIEARYHASGKRVVGAKSLLMRFDTSTRGAIYLSVILPGHSKLDSKALKQALQTFIPGNHRIRFATPEEMFEVAGGMQPGKMPPVGRPIFPNITYTLFDSALLSCDEVGFNAAHFERSFIVKTRDLVELVPHDGIFALSTADPQVSTV